MAPRRPAKRVTHPRDPQPAPSVIDRVMDLDDASLLDILDHVLNKGVMATGDLTLGVAGIDLVYVRLSTLLCAADRVLPPNPKAQPRQTRGRARRRASRQTS